VDRKKFSVLLNWDSCVECGKCLTDCRYIEISGEEAIAEIKKINSGRIADSRALDECVSCYACNAFCPNDAHPYERIHYYWNDRYEESGLPLRTSYLMPTREPNFRQSLSYNAQERELQKSWATEQPSAPVSLYAGCNLLSNPLLATGKIFDALPVWGDWDVCCGEMFFRMGLIDPVIERTEKLMRFYNGKGVEELVFVCPACYNMFTNVLPQQFGAKFDFKTTFFTDWFTRKLDAGEFKIEQELTGTVTMHDSCHGRVLGTEFMDAQREFLQRLGLTVCETPEHHEHSLCCGVAAGTNKYDPLDMVKAGYRQLKELDKAEGDQVAMYCTGCLLTLSCMRYLRPLGKPLSHLVEFARLALGEKPPRRNLLKAAQMLGGITIHGIPYYLSRKRYYL
jgi:Fe-S oxidoreductase